MVITGEELSEDFPRGVAPTLFGERAVVLLPGARNRIGQFFYLGKTNKTPPAGSPAQGGGDSDQAGRAIPTSLSFVLNLFRANQFRFDTSHRLDCPPPPTMLETQGESLYPIGNHARNDIAEISAYSLRQAEGASFAERRKPRRQLPGHAHVLPWADRYGRKRDAKGFRESGKTGSGSGHT